MSYQTRLVGAYQSLAQVETKDDEEDQPTQYRYEQKVGQNVQIEERTRGQLRNAWRSFELLPESSGTAVEQPEPPERGQMMSGSQPDLPQRDRRHGLLRSSRVLMSISERG